MGVALDIDGLDPLVPEVPDGSLVVLDGELSVAPHLIAHRLAQNAKRKGRRVHLLSTTPGDAPPKGELNGHAPPPVLAARGWDDVLAAPADHDLVVDSASLLALSVTAERLAESLRNVQERARRTGAIAVFTLEHGVLGQSRDAIFALVADALVLFRSRDDADRTVSYMRIPKWPQRGPVDIAVYYAIDDRSLLIDTRNRVV